MLVRQLFFVTLIFLAEQTRSRGLLRSGLCVDLSLTQMESVDEAPFPLSANPL